MTHDQEKILACLCDEPYSPDELAEELQITDDRVLAALRYMESKGLVIKTTTGWVKV